MSKLVVNLLAAILLLLPTVGSGQAPTPPPAPQPMPMPLPAPKPPAPAPAPPPPPAPCPCDNCKAASIDAPEEIKVWVGRPAILEIACDKPVGVIPPDVNEDVTVLPGVAANSFVVTAYAEGTYGVVIVVASAGKVKWAKVKVVAAKKPAKPDVKPDPKPDVDPPKPIPAPLPPAPVDPLAKELQNAYGLDSTPDKAEQAQALSALYKSAIDKVAAAENGAALLKDLKAVAAVMKIPDSALPLVRSRIGVELKRVMVPGVMTDTQKDDLKKLFGKLADGLSACK